MTDGLSTIAVVGEGIRNIKGAEGRILNTMLRSGIKTLACSEGNSDTTLSFVVEENDTVEALRSVHGLFF